MSGRPTSAEHIKTLGELVGRIAARVEWRRRAGKPSHIEEREIAAVKWAVMECLAAGILRDEVARLKAEIEEEGEA